MEPPKMLRIKRKRGEDPLQALILDSQMAKRSKPSSPVASGTVTPNENYYFKLTRTDASAVDGILILLSETSRTTKERNFVIPKSQTEEDDTIPNELSDLVNNFMINNDTTTEQRKKRNHSIANHVTTEPEDEFVYDVYQLSTMTNHNHPKSQIGYIKFFENSDDEFNNNSEPEDDRVYSDHEDSNAEDFYQNDYPEDEDADIETDIHNEYRNTDLENDEIDELFDYVQNTDMSLIDNYKSEDDEDYVFEDDDEDDEDDDDDYEDDGDFERQKFFDNESDDELAIHRDRIFSKLKKMVDE